MRQLTFRTCIIAFSFSFTLGEIAHADALPLVPSLGEPSLEARRAQAAALRRKARKETIAGAVLLPLGAVLVGAGAGLFVFALACEGCSSEKANTAGITGLTLGAIGSAGVLSGIPLLIAGAVHKHRARRLDPRLSIAPTFDSRGTLGASANLSFAF
jgi:hypothetical protein